MKYNQENQQNNPQMTTNLNEAPLNIIPNSQQNETNQNKFINNNIVNNINNNLEEENPMLKLNQNKFIINPEQNKSNTLDSMNVNGEYNNMPKVDYSTDPRVRQNLEAINKHGAKNTVKIGSETKVFLLIIVILLAFTFVMPTIYDAIRNAR